MLAESTLSSIRITIDDFFRIDVPSKCKKVSWNRYEEKAAIEKILSAEENKRK
jgi:hypothetical protein